MLCHTIHVNNIEKTLFYWFIVIPRHLFYNGKSIPIVLENSMRKSHSITNNVLKILLEEVVGYEKVEIKLKDSMNATKIMNRISGCPEAG